MKRPTKRLVFFLILFIYFLKEYKSLCEPIHFKIITFFSLWTNKKKKKNLNIYIYIYIYIVRKGIKNNLELNYPWLKFIKVFASKKVVH